MIPDMRYPSFRSDASVLIVLMPLGLGSLDIQTQFDKDLSVETGNRSHISHVKPLPK